MTEPMDKAEEHALWRRWRAAVANAAAETGPAPDPLILAAHAEHRLSEAEAEEIEAWLALHQEMIGDVVAARDVHARSAAAPEPSAAALANAMALVPELDPKVVSFRRAARRMQPVWHIATG